MKNPYHSEVGFMNTNLENNPKKKKNSEIMKCTIRVPKNVIFTPKICLKK
jgi:hypothetical protein